MLVQYLPPESAVAAANRVDMLNEPLTPEMLEEAHVATQEDVEGEQWSREAQLIASVRDELNMLRWTYMAVNSTKRPAWDPEPLSRPGMYQGLDNTKALDAGQTEMLAAHLARTQGGDTTYN